MVPDGCQPLVNGQFNDGDGVKPASLMIVKFGRVRKNLGDVGLNDLLVRGLGRPRATRTGLAAG